MSQRPPASRPASRSPKDGQRIILPPVLSRDDAWDARRGSGRIIGQPDHGNRMSTPTPSTEDPARLPYGYEPRQANEPRRLPPPRALGLQNVLNSPESVAPFLRGVQSSGDLRGSQRSMAGLVHYGSRPSTEILRASGAPHPGSNPTSPGSVEASYSRRRSLLTPRSPRSIGTIGTSNTFNPPDFRSSPSRGRRYTAEPGQVGTGTIPPMPPPPLGLQQAFQFGQSQTQPSGRHASSGSSQMFQQAPLSRSTSPSTTYSTYNQPGETPPEVFSAGPSQASTSYFPTSYGGALQSGPASGGGMGAHVPEGLYRSASSTSLSQTSNSQMKRALENLAVPLDRQGASKMADEKRARNAGASARFRQRRKEKEVEASSSIGKLEEKQRALERKVKDLEEDRDFYKAERDRFRDLAYRDPSQREAILQSPTSPRLTRQGTYQNVAAGPQSSYRPETGVPQSAPRRRRSNTRGDYVPSPQDPQGPPLPYGPPSGHGHSVVAQSLHNQPSDHSENTAAPSTASQYLPTTTTPAPAGAYGVYQPTSPYDRGWPGGAPSRNQR